MGDALQQTPRRLIAVVLGVAMHVWPGSALAASPTDAEPIEARLQIDTREAGGGAEVLHRRIEERANIVLREAKILPGDAEDVALSISVRELAGDEPGFLVRFELRDVDGTPLAEPTQIECSLCTETELVARTEAELEPILATLRELATAPDEPAVAPPPPEPVAEQPPTEQPPPRDRKGMLAGGISLLVLGSGALGAGVGLAIPEPKIDQANPLDLITTRPIGYALLAGGVVAATAGAVLTAVAVRQRRQLRWSMAPFGARTQAGIVIAWRFG